MKIQIFEIAGLKLFNYAKTDRSLAANVYYASRLKSLFLIGFLTNTILQLSNLALT